MKYLIASDIHGSAYWAERLVAAIESQQPDRIVLLPGGRVAFVEMKRPGGRVDPLQEYWHNQLRSLGYPVYVIYTPEDLSRVLQALKRQQPLAELELAQMRRALRETAAELRYWRGECSRLAAKE